jgi:hypothetical protein
MGKPSRKRTRTIKMTPEAMEALREQRRRFVEKFGREPGPNDPVFFDPDADTPQSIDYAADVKPKMLQAMRETGLDPAYIHAFERTDMLLTTENAQQFTPRDRAAWEATVEEYRRRRQTREEASDDTEASPAGWDTTPWNDDRAMALVQNMVADSVQFAGHAEVTDEFEALMADVDAALAAKNMGQLWRACVAVDEYARQRGQEVRPRRRFRRR